MNDLLIGGWVRLGLRWQALARYRLRRGFPAGIRVAYKTLPHALRASQGGVALTLPAAVQGCASHGGPTGRRHYIFALCEWLRYAGSNSATSAFSSCSSFTVASIFERLKSFTGTPCTISQSPGTGTRIGKLHMSPFSIP